MADYAIVITAFSREHSLSQLLKSILEAEYAVEVDIVFCLEFESHPRVHALIAEFEWENGEKIISQANAFLGLKKQMIRAFRQAAAYKGIILLEDDLLVAKGYFNYFLAYIHSISTNIQVAGCALYHQYFHYLTEFPFWPIDDGSNMYFMQVPCSWGAGYTRKQAMDLANWIESKPQIENAAGIPKKVQYWPDTSWKKTATEYAVTNHLFWSYPKTSLTTNQGVAGTHESKDGNQLQSPLSIANNNFNFTTPEETIATYDAFMEWMPLKDSPIPQLKERVDFDLHGLKTANDLWHEKVITIRKPDQEICSWGRALKPPEMNLIQNIPGNFFHLCSSEAFTNASEASIATADDMGYYQVHTSGKRAGVFLFDRILKRLKLKK